MALSIGIVGLPNVGKSTLFNALTKAGILAANYPFATIDPNIGIVPIPDGRLDRLAEIFDSAKTVHATITFVDIAGLVKGAGRGEGLGNRFLASIRDVHAICHVVRAFEAPNVVHIDHELDPQRDIATIETELAIADLETISKRLRRLEKEAKIDKHLLPRVALLQKLETQLSTGQMVSASEALMSRVDEFADLHLLTAKPVIYVFNSDEDLLNDARRRGELADLVSPAEPLFLDAQFEAELTDLDVAERQEMLSAIGQTEPGLDAVIRSAHKILGLQSYLTGGEKESRAWTIRARATAPEAAGVIHTDFERGFIAAEIVDFDKLVDAGSWTAARSLGLVRTEGRTYQMKPNDVVEFRFNV